MSKGSFGKSLKGIGSLSAKFLGPIEDAIQNSIANGGVEMSNVTITGGTIDGSIIGDSQPGPGIFTTLQSGNPSGLGYNVCFFGLSLGDSACWEPIQGLWRVSGDLLVRDISDLGNLRIVSNTISSTNANGNINLVPNGDGITNIFSGLNQSTPDGDINLNTTTGTVNINGGTYINLKTIEGDIDIEAGYDPPETLIEEITQTTFGGVSKITTINPHPYQIGDEIVINSPGLNGFFTVISPVNSEDFRIQLPLDTEVQNVINSGYSRIQSDINLTAKDNVNITGNVNIDGDLTVTGNTTYIDTTVLNIEDPVINTGGSGPLFVNDNMDRGVSSKYFVGGETKTSFFGRKDNTGCFTYIPDATETNNVFTGDPGCAIFGSISTTTINLSGGSLDICNINCNGDMTITGGTSVSINTPALNTTSRLLNLDGSDHTKDTGVTFTYQNNLSGFSGYDVSENSFVFLTETTNNNGVITGTPAPISSGSITVEGDITVTGTIYGGNINSGGGQNITIERLSFSGTDDGTPSSVINISFISITSPSNITGVLEAPVIDGFNKIIVISHLNQGATYSLSCPNGRLLDPGSGTSIAKTLKFDCPGQSINIIWDNVLQSYIIVNSGCSIE
jgi:hypothetical protein